MESTMSPRYQDTNHKPSPLTAAATSSSSSNGLLLSPQAQPQKPITRSEPANPYPTTFVQADTSSFKQVVQMLTGSSETAKQASKPASPHHHHSIPPIKPNANKKQQQQSGFKLYERRNSLKNFNINPLMPVFSPNGSGFSPRKPEILSPSILDFPALVLSPVTPLIPDPFDRSGPSQQQNGFSSSPGLDPEAEEKAIKEKGFFLHPSPASTPRDSEPRLLPLFPTTSPRASSGSSSASAAAS
ncbi:VQ motif-containing protein 4 [Stylosanthes scabra]|uniref:VQ motif-containing protein 4 n=1 Tax=Stylosanthes scabra TaxID=79078 RepID=A0ABU6S4A4_9FABA|nr:VQ motif-containing protein 4 [Stylosanthes scabra]